MWYRSQYEKRKLAKLAAENRHWWRCAAYFDKDKGRYVRIYKGRNYTEIKRAARRDNRHHANRTGVYNKHHAEVWWKWM